MRAALLALVLVLAAPVAARAAATIDVVPATDGPAVRIAAQAGASNPFISPTWTPDGAAVVSIGRDAVVAHPATGGASRRIHRFGDVFEAVLAPGGGAVTELSDTGFASSRGGIAVRDLRTGVPT